MMTIEVHSFDATRREDFQRVHADAHGTGWCHCVAWWVPTWDGWSDRTATENRELRDDLCDRGEYDGYLLHVDGVPVGWCQCGPRDRLVKLTRQFHLAPAPETWAITCFLITPGFRRRGLAGVFLDGVLADLRRRGVRRVEAFPRRGSDLGALDLWTGPESVFRTRGFTILRDDERSPVLGLELEAGGHETSSPPDG